MLVNCQLTSRGPLTNRWAWASQSVCTNNISPWAHQQAVQSHGNVYRPLSFISLAHSDNQSESTTKFYNSSKADVRENVLTVTDFVRTEIWPDLIILDDHRLSKIFKAFTPFNEKEAPVPGWPLAFFFLFSFFSFLKQQNQTPEPKADTYPSYISFFTVWLLFKCSCVVLYLEKGAYPENSYVVLCRNK